MKKIGIIGSRSRDCTNAYNACLKAFNEIYEDGDQIVSGHCPKGGDRFAEVIAKDFDLTEENGMLILYRPDWDKHGKAAGFIRNGDIAENSDVIIAVVSEDRTGGTEDTIKKAAKMGKDIILVKISEEELLEKKKKEEELNDILGI